MAKKTRKERDGIYTRPDLDGYFFRNPTNPKKIERARVPTLAEAKKVRAGYMVRAEQTRMLGFEPPTEDLFEVVVQRFLDYQKDHLSEADYERTEGIVRLHWKPKWDGKKFADITQNDIETYITSRSKEASEHTVVKEFNKIKRLYTLAVRWKLVPINIVKGIEPPATPPDRVRWLEKIEFGELLEACPTWLRPIVVFALATGMRRSEVLKLRYMDVNTALQRAYLYETKNNKSRGVPLTTMAKFALDQVRNPKADPKDRVFSPIRYEEVDRFAKLVGVDRATVLNIRHRHVDLSAGTILVVPTHNGSKNIRRKRQVLRLNEKALATVEKVLNPAAAPDDRVFFPITPNKVSVTFNRVIERTGIEDFRLHDLRHTFASWLAMSGERLQVIAEILGHSDIRVTQKYAHLSPLHLQEAAAKIDTVFMPELMKEPKLLEEGKNDEPTTTN